MSSSEHHSGHHEGEESGEAAEFKRQVAEFDRLLRAMRGEETDDETEAKREKEKKKLANVDTAYKMGQKERIPLRMGEKFKMTPVVAGQLEEMLTKIRGPKPTAEDNDLISAWFAGKGEEGWVNTLATQKKVATTVDPKARAENLAKVSKLLEKVRSNQSGTPSKSGGAHGKTGGVTAKPAQGKSTPGPVGFLGRITGNENLKSGVFMAAALAIAGGLAYDRFGRKKDGRTQNLHLTHKEDGPAGLELGDFSGTILGSEITRAIEKEQDPKVKDEMKREWSLTILNHIEGMKKRLGISDLEHIDGEKVRAKLIAEYDTTAKASNSLSFDEVEKLVESQCLKSFGNNGKNYVPFFMALIFRESGGNQGSIHSDTGVVGLMQLAPGDWKGYSKAQLLEPKVNIELGIGEWKSRYEKSGSALLAMLGYNIRADSFKMLATDYEQRNPGKKFNDASIVDLRGYLKSREERGEEKTFLKTMDYILDIAVLDAGFGNQFETIIRPTGEPVGKPVAGQTPKPEEKTEQKGDDQEDDLVEPSADDTATASASETTMVFKEDPAKISFDAILNAEIVSPPGVRQKGHHSQSEWKMVVEQERHAQYKDKWDFKFDNLSAYAKQMTAWFKEGGVTMAEVDAMVQKYSQQYGVPYELVSANVIANFNAEKAAHAPQAGGVSSIGPMQVTPEALNQYNKSRPTTKVKPEDLYTVDANFKVGVWQLRYLDDMFGQWNLALKAKKFGVGTVIKWLNERTSGDAKITEQDFSVFVDISLAQRALHSDFESNNSVSAADKAKLKQLRERISVLHKKIADSGVTLEDVPGARKYVLGTASFISVGKTLFRGDKLQLWYPEEWKKGGSGERPPTPPRAVKPPAPSASTAYGGQRVQPRGRG